MELKALENFRIFAFTHKVLPLGLVGKFHIVQESQAAIFTKVKNDLGLTELMYLSTCNRVEFLTVQHPGAMPLTAERLIDALQLELSTSERTLSVDSAEVYISDEAVKHLFKVSASLDSMVIGEREIITQVRKAYEEAVQMGLSGDFLRVVVRKTIETAKEIFTQTAIFKKPVSVVSLAFHRLRDLDVPATSRIVMIGAGKTNRAMGKFLAKHGYKNIVIYNRTLERATSLVEELGGASANSLEALKDHVGGFDVLLTCTASGDPIVTSALYEKLCAGETTRKIVIDLALPADVSHEVISEAKTPIRYINIEELRITADKNLLERSKEINHCEEIIDRNLIAFHDIYKTRQIELAMSQIPAKVREISETALNSVYAREVAGMDPESREVLNKVIAYMEKKYISVPMKMAKAVMLNRSN